MHDQVTMERPDWPGLRMLVTHSGTAHTDDLMACCLIMALAGRVLPVERRNPSTADLGDLSIAVVDIGCLHDPSKMNFDHHQPGFDVACSVTLILRAAGLEEVAREVWPWLKGVEVMDCRGPGALAESAGAPRAAIGLLDSPFREPLLSLFESGRLSPEIMLSMGRHWIESLTGYRRDLESYLAAPIHEVNGILVVQLAAPPKAAFQNYLTVTGAQGRAPHAMTYPNTRGPGTVMARIQPCEVDMDFRRIAGEPGVEFIHANGFLAVTGQSEEEAMRLIRMATTPPARGEDYTTAESHTPHTEKS